VSNKEAKPGIYVAWKTVTYRSVVRMMLLGSRLFCRHHAHRVSAIYRFQCEGRWQFHHQDAGKSGGACAADQRASAAVSQQAHFTALDGTIRVRKANGNSWIKADYNVPLEKGDVVQTGAEGMAKVVFNDGTNYTVKQDSLIVIEENSANDQQQTNVSVAVTTGTVDLTTATYVQGSKSQVIVAGAKASLAPDSSAMVRNDARADQHEILVKKGSGQIERNGEVVRLSNWEKVSFKNESKTMDKGKEVGPPAPIAPGNMMPIFITEGEKSKDVEFNWTPMAGAAGYRREFLTIIFSSLLLDRKVESQRGRHGSGSGHFAGRFNPTTRLARNRWRARRTASRSFRGQKEGGLSLDIEPFIQHGRNRSARGDQSARL
jgi:hypothetical protein